MAEQTINVPQLLLILVIGGLAIRYFFFSAPGAASSTPANRSATAVRAREADVERIQQMFPQVSRRSIMWDLQRNGGNVVATTERVLSGRGLEVPPQSFQPPLPASSSANASSASSASSTPKLPFTPDLITRYNLKSKLSEDAGQSTGTEENGTADGAKKKGQAWSANKGERQALLQRRREEMILAARRKMEAKVAAEALRGQELEGP